MAKKTPTPPQIPQGSTPADQTLISHVQDLAALKGWELDDFIAQCLSAKICGVTIAKKIWRGDCELRVKTAAGVAQLFGVTLSDVIELRYD